VKPQNETEIKVIDFGSSCYEHQRGRPTFNNDNAIVNIL